MIGKKINQLATELAPTTTDLTIIGDPVTGVSKKITLEQLGAIFGGAVSFYTTLGDFPVTGVIDIIYCAKDTKKLYLWTGSAYVEVFPSQSLLDTYQLRSEKGVSNGYASLDSGGKVPISQLPSSIMEYKGTWNAATNTPTLANGTGDTGDVYICNVAGTVNFGAGPITFAVGDYVIYSGSIWQRSSGAVGTVTSVAVSRSGDALAITGSPITTSGTINIGFAGTGAQYIKGDGTLATFPSIISQAQNLITEVYNNTGATLTKGTVVYINGGQGNLPTVTKALATSDATSAQTYGVVQTDITNMNNGYVVVEGRLGDLDTQAYANGTQLYLSPTTAGTWTSTKPYAPNHLVYVGIVVRSHPTQGVVEVKIMNGFEMDELHNVAAQNPDNNDILQYKTATSLWTKVAGTTTNIAEGSNLYYTDARSRAALSFTAGSGAYNSTTGVITIPTNTNQLTNGASFITLASLSAGAGISYNNTTGVIASTITQYTDAMARASISLTTTGTSGAATYNSTTGVLNIPNYAPDLSGYVPTSRTLTINGTAYDLSANRSWSVGTVTSVGLSSATSGVTIGSTPVTTSGTITLAIATASGSQQGLLSSTDWTTFNNKQNALTNPVTGTGTTNYLPKFTGTSTIGNSQIFDNGTNVGIGTASVSGTYEKLAVAGGISIKDNTNAKLEIGRYNTTGAQNSYIKLGANSNSLRITNNTDIADLLELTNSGNLGLGVTPSNVYADSRTFEIGANGILWSEASSSIYNSLIIGLNFYYNAGGTAVYKNSSIPSSRYIQYQGSHQWSTAPSGTAGNAISFTQAMTLDASGRLGIGTTSPLQRLHVYNSSSSSAAIFQGSSNSYIQLGVTNESYIGNVSGALLFETGGATRLTLASTGAATFSSSVTATQGIFSQGMTNGTTSAFTSPHLALKATSSTDDTGFVGMTFATSDANNYGYSYGALRENGGLGNLVWRNHFNSAQGTELMRLTYNGRLGIGTTSPQVELHVKGNNGWGEVRIEGQSFSGGNGGAVEFYSEGTALADIYSDTTKNLIFRTNGSTERMRITSGGNVGIGTQSPQNYTNYRILHLAGATSTSSALLYLTNSNNTIVGMAFVEGAAQRITFGSQSNHPVTFLTNDTERMRITSGGDVEINTGSIKTGEPDTGWGRAAIKIGASVSGAAFNVTRYLPVNVDGTVYFINLNSSTP